MKPELHEAIEFYEPLIKKECGETVETIEQKVSAICPTLDTKNYKEVFQVKSMMIAEVMRNIIKVRFPFLSTNIELKYPTWRSYFTGYDGYYSVQLNLNPCFSFYVATFQEKKIDPEEMALIEKLAGITFEQLRSEIKEYILKADSSKYSRTGWYWKKMSMETYDLRCTMTRLLFKHIHLCNGQVDCSSNSFTTMFTGSKTEVSPEVDVFITFSNHSYY